MQYNIPVEWDAMQGVVCHVLEEDIQSLREDLERVKAGNRGRVFHHDKADDIAELLSLIVALKRVKNYYGGDGC